MLLVETPKRQRVARLVAWGHWFTLFNILIALVIASVYVFSSPLPDSALGLAYMLTNWFSHIAFITFAGFIITLLPLCYLVPNERVVKGIGAMITAVSLALLALDALFFNKYGVHLSLGTSDVIRSEAQSTLNTLDWQRWTFFAVLVVIWLGFQLLLANAIWKRQNKLHRVQIATPVVSFFVFCFVFSHGAHIWADARLYQPIIQQDDVLPLSYPTTAKSLMAKYDMLDLDSYEQRKSLQLNRRVGNINYPLQPLYCKVDSHQAAMLLVLSAPINDNELLRQSDLADLGPHIGAGGDIHAYWQSALYGLPDFIAREISAPPLLAALPRGFGLSVNVYGPQTGARWPDANWQQLRVGLGQQQGVLSIALVNPGEMEALLKARPESMPTLVVSAANGMDARLFANISGLNNGPSSAEDLAPTLLNHLGCHAQPRLYSSGRNLFSPSRQWLVTSRADSLLLVDGATRVVVDATGQHQVHRDGKIVADPLNMHQLSQAIRLLSRFTEAP